MYLLFKLIKALKDPLLERGDWAVISAIYLKIDNKTYTEFKNEFLKYHPSDHRAIEFMRGWFNIMAELTEFNSYLPSKLTVDDRLLIYISLLPEDLSLLKDAVKKIEWLSCVCPKQTEINHLLRTFLQATSRFILQLENNPAAPLTLSISKDELFAIIDDIEKNLHLKKLKYICMKYLKSIIKNVGDYISNDRLCLLYYSMLTKKIHIPTLIKNEIEAIKFDAEHVKLTPLLELLFKKFMIMDDLVHILNGTVRHLEREDDELSKVIVVRNLPLEVRLHTFADHFNGCVETLKKRIYDSTYKFFTPSSYTDEPLEDKFIKNCCEIVDRILEETSYRPKA